MLYFYCLIEVENVKWYISMGITIFKIFIGKGVLLDISLEKSRRITKFATKYPTIYCSNKSFEYIYLLSNSLLTRCTI